MWDCCEPPRTLGRPPRPSSRPLSPPQWNPALVWCWQDSRGRHTAWNQSVCDKISNTFITWQIDDFECMQDKPLMLLKFWKGLCLLMCIFILIYSMNFTMTYYNAPFSHLVVNWMLRILALAQMRRQYFHQWEPRLLPSFFLQWDQSLRNWTRVLIRSPGSWAPLRWRLNLQLYS